MKRITLTSTQIIAMMLLVIILVITSYIVTINKAAETNGVETNGVETCEHDWVVCSKYVFWTNSYKIINKCSKCGKIVE